MRRKSQRRGAVLLVVLSMLFMFVIMVLTYVMIASRYRQVSVAVARTTQRGEEPDVYADRFLMQLLRGPRDSYSPTDENSLLEDMYGNNGESFRVIRAWMPHHGEDNTKRGSDQLGQLLVLGIRREDPADDPLVSRFPTYFDDKAEMDYGGRVLTVVDNSSSFNGLTTRSVRLRKVFDNTGKATNRAFLVIRMFDVPTAISHQVVRNTLIGGIDGSRGEEYTPGDSTTLGMLAGRFIYLNGSAFAGTAADTVNEPYDAADERNRFLSHKDATTGRTIPSFFRPAELNHKFNADPDGTGPLTRIDARTPAGLMDMLDRFVARPLPVYYGDGSGNIIASRHLGFSGSHPTMASDVESVLTNGGYNLADPDEVKRLMEIVIRGDIDGPDADTEPDRPWDVDNRGDGAGDSNWLDPQFPVMTTRDGRRYKILVAPLIEDLDGRVNVNAVANWAQIGLGFDVDVSTAPAVQQKIATLNTVFFGHGLGYGPAEINLRGFTGGSKRNLAELLMFRYGADRMPGTRSNYSLANNADVFLDDVLIQYSYVGLPPVFGAPPASGNTNFYGLRSNPSAYGSTPDVFGRGLYPMTHAGHPLNELAGRIDNLRDDLEDLFTTTELANLFGQWPLDIFIDERTENPYQLDLIAQNAADEPFSIQELEQILRKRDLDVAIQDGRLKPMADDSDYITTHSYEVPAMPAFRKSSGVWLSLGQYVRKDRVRARLRALKVAAGQDPNTVTDQEIDTVLRDILPFELYRGSPLNINRMLGNGRDDQIRDSSNNLVQERDGVVDNVNEIFDQATDQWETVYNYDGKAVKPYYADTRFPNLGRQLLARHVYCLLMAIVPNDHDPPNDNLTRQAWLAQLAVNIVDFRDADGTMTMFEYDEQPFDGWDVDGILDTNNVEPNSGIVWGMENPDLLLTESIAFHDRRVKDTIWDSTMKKRDSADVNEEDRDLDQYRIPQGSWFFELFCTTNRVTEDAVIPGDLYDQASGALDIGRLAGRYFDNNGDVQFTPSPSDNTIRPVWRVVVAKDTKANALNTPQGVAQVNMTLTEAEVEREVWFTPSNPRTLGVTPERSARIFYAGATRGIMPGQYAVVGPREETILGSRDPAIDSGLIANADPPVYAPSLTNRIFMNDPVAGVGVLRYQPMSANTPPTDSTPPLIADPNGGSNDVLRDTLPSVPIIVSANAPEMWGGWDGTERIGLNLTEPLPYAGIYYPKPTRRLAPGFPLDSYYDAASKQGALPNVPFDQSAVPTLPSTFRADDARPIRSMLWTKTYDNEYDRAAYLQRLADPTLPWDVDTNPYITVDTMALDLTVFNGEDKNHNGGFAGNNRFDRLRASGTSGNGIANNNSVSAQVNLVSRMKNHRGDSFWTLATHRPSNTDRRYTNEYFGFALFNSLGYYNDNGDAEIDVRKSINDSINIPIEAQFVGSPKNTPIPWLGWNDRPYNSVRELLHVPVTSPSRFLAEFNFRDGSFNPYDDTNTTDLAEFSHLFNWFWVDNNGTPKLTTQSFFDFVEVPSPFVNTQELINPFDTAISNETTAEAFTFNDAFLWLRPPFNTISRFRNPGKINVNTIPGQKVWDAMTWRALQPGTGGGTYWNRFANERRGYTPKAANYTTVTDVLQNVDVNFDPRLDPDEISEFAGAVVTPSATEVMNRDPHELGMLRPDSTGNAPAFANEQRATYADSARNVPNRYQEIQRLENLTTHQSNVFAVWLTFGYFEVTPREADVAHPDGFRLGKELGSDDGSTERPRFFYIIDRSIPVGYQKGQDLNTRQTIRLKRRID